MKQSPHLTQLETDARDELAALAAAPQLSDRDLARLPVLAAVLGVAVRVRRVDWSAGVDHAVRTERQIGAVRDVR